MKLAITICATEGYCYALKSVLRAIKTNIEFAGDKFEEYSIILVGDGNLKTYEEYLKNLFGENYTLVIKAWKEHKNYEKDAQRVIAEMRSEAFAESIKQGANWCWSIDSDVIPPDNALLCSLQMLEFDNGYYSIACCPYPSQGGGPFLTGFGSPTRHIHSNFDLKELEIPKEKKKELDDLEKEIKEKPSKELFEKKGELVKQIEKTCPPKFGGNIWKIIAKFGWKRRGWFDYAYPAIGQGAVVPTDWCGFGCTLMNRNALLAANFSGYEGKGTEDLYIVWNRWYSRGYKLCTIPHCPCDHIIRRKEGETMKYIQIYAYHEQSPEYFGHLRRAEREFFEF